MTTRRRTKGEGSITKTTNGKYRVRIEGGYFEGKRIQLSATCSTLAEARVKLREFEKLRSSTNVAASTQMSFRQLCQSYIAYKRKKEDIKETTLYDYDRRLKALPTPLLDMPLNKIATDSIDHYITDMRLKGIKDNTIKTNITIIGGVFNYAIRILNLIQTNPIHGAKHISMPSMKPNMEILSEDEHKRIRTYMERNYQECFNSKASKPNYKAFVFIAYMLAYELGLREGEVLGLRWSRINFEEKTILIDNQIVKISNQGVFDTSPKTLASIRTLIVSDGLLNILREYMSRFRHTAEDDHLFSKDIKGTKILLGSTLYRNFKKALRAVGITRHFTFHMIRHTNATRLIEKTGNDYKTVSERLGHSSVSITFNVYAHAIKKQHQLAASLMDCTK